MITKTRFMKAGILNQIIIHDPIIWESQCQFLHFFFQSLSSSLTALRLFWKEVVMMSTAHRSNIS